MAKLDGLNRAIEDCDHIRASNLHWDVVVAVGNIDIRDDSMPDFDFVWGDGRSVLEHTVLACERAAEIGVMPAPSTWHGQAMTADRDAWSRRTSQVLAGASQEGWALDRLVMAYATHGLIDINRCDLKLPSSPMGMSAVDLAISEDYGCTAAAFIKAGASLENIPNRAIRIQVEDETSVDIKPGDLMSYLDLMITDSEHREVLVEAIRARRAEDAAAAMNEQIAMARHDCGNTVAHTRASSRLSL